MFESFSLLIVLAAVGLAYAAGLMQVAMASIPRILSGVFGTAVGSMAFITKLLVSTIVLIVEIMGTILLYQLTESIILGFLRGVTSLISSLPVALSGPMDVLSAGLTAILALMVGFFAIKNRSKFSKMLEETVTNSITKLMGGLDSTMNQGNAFHDPNAVRGGAGAGTVFGEDGKVGSKGSGAYNAAAISGSNDPGILDDMKGATKDTMDQKNRMDRDPNSASMTKSDVAAGIANRMGKRRTAAAKDSIADAFGPAAGMLGAAIGVNNLDGFARERNAEDEALDREKTTNSEFGIGEDLTPNPDKDVSTNGNPESLTESELDSTMQAVDNQSADDIVADIDLDEESAAMLEDGQVDASQETMGSIEDVVAAQSENDAYGVLDKDADQAMLAAVAATGVAASAVDLDDPESHPAIDPMSEEYDSYVDGLGAAVEKQVGSAEKHATTAKKLEGEADALEAKARTLEAEGSPESITAAKDMREQATAKRVEAEAEKKQGRQAVRKAQKLGNKQVNAQEQRKEAMNNIGKNQSKPAQAAAAYASAQQQATDLDQKAEGLRDKLADLSENDPDNFLAIAKTHDQLRETEDAMPKAREEVLAAEQKAIAALPDDNFQDLHAMTQPELKKYQKEHNLSDERMQNRLDETPTAAEHLNGQRNAAMMLGKMAEQVGQTPAETKQKQRAFIQQRASKAYDKPRNEAMGELATANDQLDDLKTAGAPPEQIAQAEQKLSQAVGKVQSIDNEQKAFSQNVLKGQTANQNHLSQQMNQVKRAEQSDTKQAGRQNYAGGQGALAGQGQSAGQYSPEQISQSRAKASKQLNQSERSLKRLQATGAPAAEIKQAEQQVGQAANRVQALDKLAANSTNVAPNAGQPSSQQINQARTKAVQQLTQAKQAVQTMQATGAPTAEIKQAEQQVGQATNRVQALDKLAANSTNAASGSGQQAPQQIKQARTKAVQQLTQAKQAVQTMQATGAPASQVAQARQQVSNAASKVKTLDQALASGSTAGQGGAGTFGSPTQRLSESLAPSVSAPKDMGDVPDLRATATATGSIARKRNNLKKQSVASYDDYQSRIQSVGYTVRTSEREVARLDSRIKAAESKKLMGDAAKMRSQKLRVEQTLAQAKTKNATMKKDLSGNVAGLFPNGFKPNNRALTTGSINVDMESATNALQQFASTQKQYEILDAGLPENPTIAQKTRHKQLSNRVNLLRNQLMGSGIRKDQLMDSRKSTSAAQSLTKEWTAVKQGHWKPIK